FFASSPDLRQSQRFPPVLLDELPEAGQLRVGEERFVLEKLQSVAAGFGNDRRVAENLPISSGIGRRKAARASRPQESALW
ncbi:MAG: hypothetical protein WCH79_17800, partial [Planctomycetia bacterium]